MTDPWAGMRLIINEIQQVFLVLICDYQLTLQVVAWFAHVDWKCGDVVGHFMYSPRLAVTRLHDGG